MTDTDDLHKRGTKWLAKGEGTTEVRALVRDLRAEVKRLQAEARVARALLGALVKVADRGGPSNWRDFVDDIDARALAASLTEEP